MELRYVNEKVHDEMQRLENSVQVVEKELTVSVFENAIIVPLNNKNEGGVFDKNNHYISQSGHNGDWYQFGGGEIQADVNYLDENVIFGGYFIKQWGHFLLESLTRLWILKDDTYKGKRLVILKTGTFNNELSGNYLDLYRLCAKHEIEIVVLSEPTRFRSVVIPDESILDGRIYTKSYIDLFQSIIENALDDCINVPEKIYFSRCKFKKAMKSEIGEERIQECFAENGYEICYPEVMSIKEQINSYHRAKKIVCMNGTVPLNMLFSCDKTKWIVLNKMSKIHRNLIDVSKITNNQPVYIDVYKEPIKNHPQYMGRGPFWVEVSLYLKKYFEDRGLSYTQKKERKFDRIKKYVRYYRLYLYGEIKSKMYSFYKNNIK